MKNPREYPEEDRPLNTTELLLTGAGVLLGGLLTITLYRLKTEIEDRERRNIDAA